MRSEGLCSPWKGSGGLHLGALGNSGGLVGLYKIWGVLCSSCEEDLGISGALVKFKASGL